MEDFAPWDGQGDLLFFKIGIGNEVARVTRRCLLDHKLVDFKTTTPEQFSVGPIANELRRLGRSLLNRGMELLIDSEVWEQCDRV